MKIPKINSLEAIGVVTMPPRFAEFATPAMFFTIEFDTGYKSRKGWQESFTSIACSVWGKQIEELSKTLVEGSTVYIKGKFSFSTHTSEYTVMCNNVQVLSEPEKIKPRERQTQPAPIYDDDSVPF